MRSTPTENTDIMPTWDFLPYEIRGIILTFLLRHDSIAPYAAVSEEWRDAVEKKTFHRLKLHPSCLDRLEQLDERQIESVTWYSTNNKIIKTAITRLFNILESWELVKGGVTLELNAYSPSDSEHWFKNCYFGAPGEDELLEDESLEGDLAEEVHDPNHGWSNGRIIGSPPDDALRRPFELAELEFKEHVPSVIAVTKFILRRQCRRQFDPSSLSFLWSKLPRLEQIVYEPWQLAEKPSQYVHWERYYHRMITELPASVNTMTIFEDFNENYLELFQRMRGRYSIEMNPDRVRITTPAVGAAFAKKSLQLEHLSVAFLIDAWHFFDTCLPQPQWQWDQLRSLTLTSRKLTPKTNTEHVNRLLQTAAQAALRMPKLEDLTIWNGAKGEACAFMYRRDASVTWRATWDLYLDTFTCNAWKKVADQYARFEFRVDKELLGQEIKSHGDAIHYLGLHSVLDGVSLRQIRRENKGT
ncbi:hypothetical protein FSARC_2063 [Fusarium sarcochroum]|uniref:DUF6546 domain-containing protein n=1 Tax=Fusarium sarcochroum TaxID=1208366 RepID=A0A8H4U7D8_9HYPO|nr:hypothetical protein FSARC_2063 [Fusarium sarcochroum]